MNAMDLRFLDELAQRLAGVLPPGSEALKRDVEKNFQAVLRSSFAKLDLVTRDEFEVQADVLARSRAKVDALEKRLKELEAKLAEK